MSTPNPSDIQEYYRMQEQQASGYFPHAMVASNNTRRTNTFNPALQRGKHKYWNGTSSVTRRYSRDDTSLTIAVVPPQEEPDVTIRQLAFATNTQTIAAATKPAWDWKVSALSEVFDPIYPGSDRDAARICLDAKERTNDVWRYTDPKVLTSAYQPYVPTAGGNAAYDAAELAQIRWIQYTVTIDPRQLPTTQVDATQLPAPQNFDVFIRLPTDAGGLVVSPHFSKANLETATNYLTVISHLPASHKTYYYRTRPDKTPTAQLFDYEFNNFMAKIQYYVMVQLIQKTYVSEASAQQSIMARLAACTQAHINDQGKYSIFTVTEYAKRFREILQGAPLDPTEAQAQVPDISQIFAQGLIANIKTTTKILALQRTNNLTPITAYAENQQRFEEMVAKALEVETDNTNIVTTAGMFNKSHASTARKFQSSGTGSAASTAHTFLAMDNEFITNHGNGTVSLSPAARLGDSPAFQANFAHSTDQGGTGLISMLCSSNEPMIQEFLREYDSLCPEDQRALSTFHFMGMSNVEYALQKSSGTMRPIECWGCKGPHLYTNCPHKDDPAVNRNFKENLEKYRKEQLALQHATKSKRTKLQHRIQGRGHVKRQTQRIRQQGNLQGTHDGTQRQHDTNGT